MRALPYEESLSSWEVAAYARPKLSIRITDGCYRLVTHIPLPVGLAIEAREAWQQERREQAFCRFFRIQNVRGPMLTSPPLALLPAGPRWRRICRGPRERGGPGSGLGGGLLA